MDIKDVKIGTPVIFWEVIEENGSRSKPSRTTILSESWELEDGESVCRIYDKVGCVSIRHLDSITPGSLYAARSLGLSDVSDEEIHEVTGKFFIENAYKYNRVNVSVVNSKIND